MNKEKFNKINESMKEFCTQDIRNFANEKMTLGRQALTLILTFSMLGVTGFLIKLVAEDESIPKEALDMMMALSIGIILPIGFLATYFYASAKNIYKYLYLKETRSE